MSDGDAIKCTFWLLPSNEDRLWTVTATQGESATEAINRAIAFYEEIHRLAAPVDTGRFLLSRRRISTLSWYDNTGERRRIARIA